MVCTWQADLERREPLGVSRELAQQRVLPRQAVDEDEIRRARPIAHGRVHR